MYWKNWALGIVVGTVIAVLGGSSLIAEQKSEKPAGTESPAPKIQLAILLDTSGSMQGLINQARTQLWRIVNELATTRRNGRPPELQVALYEYGKSSLRKEDNYLRMIVPLTDDLDRVSEELFALATNGGEEYCGAVIDAAVRQLKWSDSDEDLKLIFIAGNEPFSQGGVDYKQACGEAIRRGITVNTIFCGPEAEGIRTGWRHGAELADGSFLHIDQNRQVATIATPFDKRLAELSQAVNDTYVLAGDANARKEKKQRLLQADAAAAKAAPAAAAERAAFKSSGRYAVADDLVESLRKGKLKLEDLKEEQLPEELRKLDPQKRREYLEAKAKRRAEIEAEIRKLTEQRRKYIAEARKKAASEAEADTLDTAVIKVLRAQAARKGFETPQEEQTNDRSAGTPESKAKP